MSIKPISNVTSTWSDSGTAYTGIGLNVYATSYSSSSKPFNVRVNGQSIFSIDTAGTIKNNSLDITFATANSAYDFANNLAVSSGNPVYAHRHANAAYDTANAGFAKANTSLQNTSGTFAGNMTVTGTLTSVGNLYAPVFYDSNDTNYYLDPAGTSYLNDVRGNIFYQRDDTNSRWDAGLFVLRGTSPTIYFRDTDNNSAMLHNNSSLFYILRGGNDTESYSQVNGQWPVTVNLTNNDMTVGGSFGAIGNVTAYASDKRLKDNIKVIPNAIEKIKKIRGVTFDWNDKAEECGFIPERKYDDIGCIAQEVQEVLPNVVTLAPFDRWVPGPGEKYSDEELKKMKTSKSGEDYLTIQYDKIVPLLIQAIKEQQDQIDELKRELGKL